METLIAIIVVLVLAAVVYTVIRRRKAKNSGVGTGSTGRDDGAGPQQHK